MFDGTEGTRFVLVRHGASRAYDDGVVGGPRGCRGLSEAGRAQAALLRDRLRATHELEPDVVLTSILPRAVETADIVGEAFAAGVERIEDCDYCELHPGDCDGLKWEEFRDKYGWRGDPDQLMSPNGESFRTFDARVRRATAALLETYRGRRIVVFTHGGFISAAVRYMLGAPGMGERHASPFRLEPANTSLTVFSATAGGKWMFERYNDIAHLGSSSVPS